MEPKKITDLEQRVMIEYGLTLADQEETVAAIEEIVEDALAETAVAVTTPLQQELLTVAEVAAILRLDPTTVRRYIGNGLINAIGLPHKNKRMSYRIRRTELERLLSTTIDG